MINSVQQPDIAELMARYIWSLVIESRDYMRGDTKLYTAIHEVIKSGIKYQSDTVDRLFKLLMDKQTCTPVVGNTYKDDGGTLSD